MEGWGEVGPEKLNYMVFEISRQFQPTCKCFLPTTLLKPTWYLGSKDNYRLETAAEIKINPQHCHSISDDMPALCLLSLLFLAWLAHRYCQQLCLVSLLKGSWLTATFIHSAPTVINTRRMLKWYPFVMVVCFNFLILQWLTCIDNILIFAWSYDSLTTCWFTEGLIKE